MRFGVVYVVCACVAVALAATYGYTGKFVETRSSWTSYASIEGTFAYLYDTANDANCRLYFEYTAPSSNTKVTFLYQFLYDKGKKKSVLYSYCKSKDKCTADTVPTMPDPFYYDSSVYKQGSTSGVYVKKSTSKADLVKSIKMNNAGAGSNTVSEITFKDGRHWTLTEFKHDNSLTLSNSKFKRYSKCPEPGCAMLADVVFVLDVSGSVDEKEWSHTTGFVKGVLNSFQIGKQATAAAIVWFSDKAGYVSKLSTSKNGLLNAMKSYKRQYGDTCQAKGLSLACDVFKTSSRNSLNPNRIVISVTDGQDHCKQNSESYFKKLKNTYHATVITIGVGNGVEKKWLQSQASKSSYYFSVDSYSKMNTLVNKLFDPVCDEFSTKEKPCKGLSGCGLCFCPTCSDNGDKCNPVKCDTSSGTSHGCVATAKNCRQKESTKCYIYGCDKNTGKCTETDPCKTTKTNYPYKCQTVSCKDGSCPVTYNDDYCKQKHRSSCELWQCKRDAKGSGTNPDADGCVLKTNVTKTCLEKKSACVNVKCDTSNLACVVEDLCTKKNNKCHTFTCTGTGNSAYCADKVTSRPSSMADDACSKYICNNNSGWIKDESRSLDAGKCRDKATGTKTCLIFSCDKKNGCVNTTDKNCVKDCAKIEQTCWSSASSTLQKCETAKCVGTSAANIKCQKTSTDCTKSAAAKSAKENNAKNNGMCYSYKCSYGSCELFEVLPRRVSTKCVTWKCVGSIEAGWKWQSSYTTAYTNCKNDSCYQRKCDDSQGCIAVNEICVSKSTNCKSYTCNANKSCVEKNLLKKYDCMHEECAKYGTKIAVWDKDYHVACPEVRNCTNVTCPRDKDDPNYGRCVYTPFVHDDDNCTRYVCNKTTNTRMEEPNVTIILPAPLMNVQLMVVVSMKRLTVTMRST